MLSVCFTRICEVAEIIVIGRKLVVRAIEVGIVVEVEGVRVTVAVSTNGTRLDFQAVSEYILRWN